MASFRIRDILSCPGDATAAFCSEENSNLKQEKFKIQSEPKISPPFPSIEDFTFDSIRAPPKYEPKHNMNLQSPTAKDRISSPQKQVENYVPNNCTSTDNSLTSNSNKISNNLIKKEINASLNRSTIGPASELEQNMETNQITFATPKQQQIFKFHSLIPNLFIKNDVTAQQSQRKVFLQQQQHQNNSHVILKDTLISNRGSNLSGDDIFMSPASNSKSSPTQDSAVQITSPATTAVILSSQNTTLSQPPPNNTQFFSNAANCATLNNIC